MGECTICTKPARFAACDRCLQKLFDDLHDISIEYQRLDPSPTGVAEQGRRSPGFRSQSPANDHVIALRDRRTRAKVAGDLQNAHTFMADWLLYIQADRGMAPRSPVSIEAAFYALRSHSDWIERQGWFSELAMGARTVLAQLRTANGHQPPTKVGTCPDCEAGTLTLAEGWVNCGLCEFRVNAEDLLAEHYPLAA